MKDFGTSKSTKIDSIFDRLLLPRPSRSLTSRDHIASSSPLRGQSPNDSTPCSEARFVSPLAQGTTGLQSHLTATGDNRLGFQPSLALSGCDFRKPC
ncbi:MAG: hypothetical protein ABW068_10695 [Candidatus Thiodiazotropha sp.]